MERADYGCTLEHPWNTLEQRLEQPGTPFQPYCQHAPMSSPAAAGRDGDPAAPSAPMGSLPLRWLSPSPAGNDTEVGAHFDATAQATLTIVP
jgi:hypothetical protein